ncbi:MAG: hypothetical protein ACYDFS_01625 [Vulcanimicrobiaceae bacterium]
MTSMTTQRLDHPAKGATSTGRLRAAVLRKPGAALVDATPLLGEPSPIYSRALEAHATLVKTLQYFGVQVTVLEASGDDAREVAIGDVAVTFDDGLFMMRQTSMARRAEAESLESEIAHLGIPRAGGIEAPGLLDGGDVLLLPGLAVIGVGSRGNDLGRAGFAQAARARGYDVVEARLAPGVPSLRCVAGVVARDTVVIAAHKVDPAAFARLRRIELDRGEEFAAGALLLGERHVLADIRYRTSLAKLRKAGIAVDSIDLYEFDKAGLVPALLALASRRS